jgi:predicted heme/steroid binding protein
MTNSDLAELMSVAGKRDAALGITGLLAYNGRNSMQALEGDPGNVLDVIKSIWRDDRHIGVIIIQQADLAERASPDWSMRLTNTQQVNRDPANILTGNGFSSELLSRAPGDLECLFGNLNGLGLSGRPTA